MPCPACSGKGYRLLRIGPDQGLCATCGGAGSVQSTQGTAGSWAFNVAPCTSCGGSGVRPLQYGATRDGLEQVGGRQMSTSPGGSGGSTPGGDSSYSGEGGEDESQTTDKDTASDDRSFFSKYKTWLLIGLAALVIVGLIAMKSSKK